MQGRNEVRRRLEQETSLTPPCSNLRSVGSKCTVLKKVRVTLLWLFSPRSDSASGELSPWPPPLRPWWSAIKIGKFSENKQIFKSEPHELLFNKHLQFSNTIHTPWPCSYTCTDCQQRLLAAFQVSSCSFWLTPLPAPRVFRRGPVFVLRIIKQQATYFRLDKFENNFWIVFKVAFAMETSHQAWVVVRMRFSQKNSMVINRFC